MPFVDALQKVRTEKHKNVYSPCQREPCVGADGGTFLATLELMFSFDGLHFTFVTVMLIPW